MIHLKHLQHICKLQLSRTIFLLDLDISRKQFLRASAEIQLKVKIHHQPSKYFISFFSPHSTPLYEFNRSPTNSRCNFFAVEHFLGFALKYGEKHDINQIDIAYFFFQFECVSSVCFTKNSIFAITKTKSGISIDTAYLNQFVQINQRIHRRFAFFDRYRQGGHG